ncbi:hypothetical protein AAVH_13925 [Aphelenchoides avenae]|nr:hypothetical protein AAVH_13925 [Aphelenchus avenae]
MLSPILNDVLLFASTPDLAAILLASRHFSAVADGVVARRTLRAVWIRQLGGHIHVSTAVSKSSGATSFQFEVLSASDDVEQKLRPLLLGGIVELFVLPANALADRSQKFDWFVDVLRSLLVGIVVSRTLRLHLSDNYTSFDSIYAVVERFHYVNVRSSAVSAAILMGEEMAQVHIVAGLVWSRIRV